MLASAVCAAAWAVCFAAAAVLAAARSHAGRLCASSLARRLAKRHHHSFWNGVMRLLHLTDSALPPVDSCGSLRHLWFKAVANGVGAIRDDVASDLLPPVTRFAASAPLLQLWAPFLPYQPALVATTSFVDECVEAVVDRAAAGRESLVVVTVGAGYGTRSVRTLRAAKAAGVAARAIDIDTGDNWSERRRRMYARLCCRRPELASVVRSVRLVDSDLNEHTDLAEMVGKVSADERTLFVFEGVLCFVRGDAALRVFNSALCSSLRCASVILADTLPIPPAPVSGECMQALRRKCSYQCAASCASMRAEDQYRRAMEGEGWRLTRFQRAPKRKKVKHCIVAEPLCGPASPCTARRRSWTPDSHRFSDSSVGVTPEVSDIGSATL
eukprot:TRINITY_DN1415_c3_g1_i1.p1 TRINITY_DN1415_c3_g1~~TRINITY_DN1415_c3_g1_i1.p1  ORF type:complete len:384 (+),score=47.30 TRINITY_DN1415_c3_g1_i1:250-1401(+)